MSVTDLSTAYSLTNAKTVIAHYQVLDHSIKLDQRERHISILLAMQSGNRTARVNRVWSEKFQHS